MNVINWSQFEAVDMRVGTIIEVAPFPEAQKPAYKLNIDFGNEIGIKKSSAQITKHYTESKLLHRQVVAVVNFPPKQIANFISECLILGSVDANGDVILLQPESKVKNGLRIL